MTPEDAAQDILNGLIPRAQQVPTDDLSFVLTVIRGVIAKERWECAEAVKRVANDIQTDDESEYKAGIVASLAAIRARKEHSE
jgi:hypothetical protein